MSLDFAEKALRNYINEHATVAAIVRLTEYDLERNEPAHGAVEFHTPLYFKLADFWAGGAAASGSVRATPETRKKTKIQRGRAFVALVLVRMVGGSMDVLFQLSSQIELFPHDTTVLQLRSEGSFTNNDSLELLLDSEQYVVGVKYIMSPDKHKTVIDSLIAQVVTDQVFSRFQHTESSVDQNERIAI